MLKSKQKMRRKLSRKQNLRNKYFNSELTFINKNKNFQLLLVENNF
jgi:hypothetical protein